MHLSYNLRYNIKKKRENFMLQKFELECLKNKYNTIVCNEGDIIFPQGQIANGAYIVISGLIHLKKKHKDENLIEHLGNIGPGDTFGAWYVLFESKLRMVSAEAVKKSELVFIPNKVLEEKLKSCDPFIIYCFRKWIDLIGNKKGPIKEKTVDKVNRSNDPKFNEFVS